MCWLVTAVTLGLDTELPCHPSGYVAPSCSLYVRPAQRPGALLPNSKSARLEGVPKCQRSAEKLL